MSELSGSELKRLREALHVPLEQVASETRIRLSILQDLEDEEYSELSSGAQTKGFLRIYENYLESIRKEAGLTEPEEADETQQSGEAPDQPASPEQETPGIEEEKPEPTKDAPEQALQTPSPKPDPEPVAAVEPSPTPVPESEYQKILAQVGRELASRRRYLNLQWDLIIEQTRLKRDTLRALESGDLEAFSTPLEFRKDLQTYTRFLNLDVETVMIQFAEALQKRRSENLPKKRPKRERSSPASRFFLNLRRFFTLDLLFGTILILGILAFLIWGISNMRQRSPESPQTTETLPALIDFILTTPTEPSDMPETPEPEVEQAPGIPTATAFFVQFQPEKGIRLSLHARQNVWIRVFTDKELHYVGRIAAGEVRTISADETIQLETSNISGLEMAFQGSAIDPIFRAFGSPARFIFDLNGMQEVPVFEHTATLQNTPVPAILTPGAP
jgi:cytoskeletal protein RodZ